jgi:D-alanyl-D-alanine carboxypeptidase
VVVGTVSACASSGGSIEDSVAPVAPTTEKYAAIVVDAKSGKMLYGANSNELRYPASLTKMMTLYMMFEAMDQGRINRDGPHPHFAQRGGRPPSKLGLKAGQSIPGRHGDPGACGQVRQ